MRISSKHKRGDFSLPVNPPMGSNGDQPVMAFGTWLSNAHLIADIARLNYLQRERDTLDPTWGLGNFWTQWRPDDEFLIGSDIVESRSPMGVSIDFRDQPWNDRAWYNVVFDPPYKLNGTMTKDNSGRMMGVGDAYGVSEPATWQARIQLCIDGLIECARVLGDGHLLMKCQDQVASGKVRWQSHIFTSVAIARCGLELVDRFDMQSYRPQPDGVRQVHARRNASTMLVFTRV